jgi:phage-related protein
MQAALPALAKLKEQFSDPLGRVGEVLKGITGTFERLGAVLTPFVQAINPAAVQAFSMAMRDLTAVVGSAVAPALQATTAAVRQFGGWFLTAFNSMRPLFDKLAGVVSQVLTVLTEFVASSVRAFGPVRDSLGPVITALGAILRGLGEAFRVVLVLLGAVFSPLLILLGQTMRNLLPIFDAIAAAGKIVADVITVLSAGFTAMLQTVVQAFGGFDLGKLARQIVDGFQAVGRQLILFTAILAKVIGAVSFLDGMIRALSAKPTDTTGFAAVGAAFKGIEALGKEITQAAYVAAGKAGGEMKTEDYLAGLLDEVKGIADSNISLSTIIRAAVAEGFVQALESAKGAVFDPGGPGASIVGRALPFIAGT